ncbi:helix-turn-helix domain-containing protein [Spiroplasma floricola]|uniref:helix-turn-helix domain-containing protein n=1 Tax=Spiroplasma floricola TaxID=216937 RepID=UPI0012FE0B43|nr:helix-turn-helix domain-containing protein [Spiroplasma floricola]
MSIKFLYFCFIPLFPYKIFIKIVFFNKNHDNYFESFRIKLFLRQVSALLSNLAIFIVILCFSTYNLKYWILISMSLCCVIVQIVFFSITVYSIKNKVNVAPLKFFYKMFSHNSDKRHKSFKSEIISEIDNNNGILTYKELNTKFSISLKTLNNIVIEFKNTNFKTYSIQLKMEFAKSLYQEANYSTKQIAEKCGYLSKSSFLKAYNSYYK